MDTAPIDARISAIDMDVMAADLQNRDLDDCLEVVRQAWGFPMGKTHLDYIPAYEIWLWTERHEKAVYRALVNGESVFVWALLDHPEMLRAFRRAGRKFDQNGDRCSLRREP